MAKGGRREGAGRPKKDRTHQIQEDFTEFAREKAKSKKKLAAHLEVVTDKLIELALKGDRQAILTIVAYFHGKPTEEPKKVEHMGSVEFKINWDERKGQKPEITTLKPSVMLPDPNIIDGEARIIEDEDEKD